ncbi:NlpC/P60 family protein [Candidatus Solincola sp.]|nr:NlpC/P60 family protein [Actinomycetota bacterium]
MTLSLVLVLFLFPMAPGKALAQAFNDLSGQPAEIRQAIEYSVQMGYMQGFPDGGFHPNDALTRLDCAKALVRVFGHAGESADPGITFTDLAESHPDFIWANLAVKHGLMDRLPDGSFQPSQGVVFERVAIGVTAGMGLNDVAANVNALTGGYPYYGGAMAVFMDLHCKYRYSRVWPGQAYPRGEMAYTLYRLDHMESWRPWYVRDSFSPSRCAVPLASEEQLQAIRYGFERLGCPYVYGGERESEGGFDCSGFVYNTLSIRMGYPMMRVADDQARDNRYLFVSREALQPGDAIFFYESAGDNPDGYIGHAGMYVGNGIFIHSTGSNGGVSFDCLDNNDYWRTHFAWGRRVVGGPYNDRFDTWLLLYNPGEGTQPVNVRFMRSGRAPETRSYQLAPHSRFTLPVDNLYAYDELSMEVEAPAPGVVAERAMYFDYGDWADDGHAGEGASEPSTEGYFAEGYTGQGFHTWLLMVNPNDAEALVEVAYLPEGRSPVTVNYSIPPRSRFTVRVNGVPGLPAGSVGLSYRSLNGVPIAAERAMYFDYFGKRGGHCSAAVENPSTRLFLAEGYTGGGFDTWILLANPNPEAAEVEVTYLVQGGENVSERRTVPAHSRVTINARDRVPGASFGTVIESLNGVGVVAERAMYFDYFGKRGGHCSAAVENPSTRLFLAEGYTGGGFDTWILLANPNPEAAHVRLVFCREDSSTVSVELTVPAGSRVSRCVDEIAGMGACSFATRMESDLPLFMERSMYFFYKDRSGGTNCTAQEGPYQRRFFAEGYTGG